MAKKWTISDGPPLKVRLVGEKESEQNADRVMSKPIRVRSIGRRIVKVLVALWVLSVGGWLSACDRYIHNTDGPHDTIDGQDPFGGL